MAKQLRQSERGSSVNDPIDISDDDSEVKREPNLKTSLPSSAGKKANQGQHKRATELEHPITKTPIPYRPSLIVSPPSNASSTTTIDSIWDSDSKPKTPGTPLTPPVQETPTRKPFNRPSKGSRPSLTKSFEDLPLKPRSPSSDVSAKGGAYIPLAGEDDLTLSMSVLSIEDALDQLEEDSSDSSLESPISKDKSKRATELPTRSNRKEVKSTDKKPPVIEIRGSESANSTEDDSEYSAEEPLVLRKEQSQRKANHKRSSSAPKYQYTADVTDTEIDSESAHAGEDYYTRTISTPASIPKSRKRGSGGASTLSVTSRKTRSRSTGSIPEEKTSLPIPTPEGQSGDRVTTSTLKQRRASSTTDPSPTTNPQSTPTSEDSQEKESGPIFTPFHEKDLSDNDVKNLVLEIMQNGYGGQSFMSQLWEIWKSIRRSKTSAAALSKIEGGFVYIFELEEYASGYLKIGQTKNRVSKRITAWKYKCGGKPTQIGDENEKQFLHFQIVEKIVHAELAQVRKKYVCECGTAHKMELSENNKGVTTHNEWFKVGVEVALGTINKWRDWVVQMQPYHDDGSLRACWVWKCQEARSTKSEGFDWVKFREFSWPETAKCCRARFSRLFGSVWRLKVLSSEFCIVLFWAGAAYLVAGLSILSCWMFLAFICLYIIGWFNFS